MNKHIIDALSDYGFTYEKNRGYGKINGYEVNVVDPYPSNGPFFYFSTNLSNEKKKLFVVRIKEARIPLVVANVFEFGVVVMIGCYSGGSFKKKFPKVMGLILNTLSFLEAPKSDICPQSGEVLDEENSVLGFFNGLKIRLTKTAHMSVRESIDQSNEEFKKEPNNYLKGYLGIFLGGVAGVLATVIFSLMGIVSALSSLISVFLGIFLYKKFGGKPNWVMIVMAFITTIVFIVGYILFAYVSYSVEYLAERGITKAGMDALVNCLNLDGEVKKAFISDMIMNSVFCIIGILASIFYVIAQVRRPQKLK